MNITRMYNDKVTLKVLLLLSQIRWQMRLRGFKFTTLQLLLSRRMLVVQRQQINNMHAGWIIYTVNEK